jgi:pimeloyl-[acyl-carrier protein] methyl ester esterase
MKTPLVLLHGWGVNSQIWEAILPDLSESFEVHVLDLPGYGNDTRYTGSFTEDSVVERVLSSAPNQAYWIAWSLGATVAMQAALQYPERFLKLQLVSATPKFMAAPGWDVGMQAEPLHQLVKQFDSGYENGLKKFLMLQSAHQENARNSIRKRLDSILKLPTPAPETLGKSLNLLTSSDLRERITGLKIETQVVAGRFDQVVSPLASQWLAEAIPGAEFVKLETGHLPFLDSKADFLANLQTFAEVPIG